MPIFGGINSRLLQQKLFFSRVPFIDEIVQDNMDVPTLTYPEVFTVRNSDRAFETITGVTGLGLFEEKAEGEKIVYDTVLEAYDKRFVHLTYSKGVQYTRELIRDDFERAIVELTPALPASARVSMETTIWNLFNNGFSGGTETTPDGQPVFSTAHVLIAAPNFDNVIVGDFGVATLEDALNRFALMTNDRGLPIVMEPTLLVANPFLRWDVHEVLKSVLRSDTANNAANAFSQVGLKPVFSRYITGTDDWFVGVAPNKHRIIVYWREQPTLDHTIDFETGNGKTKMEYALSVGAADWKGWVGSQG